MAVRAVEFPGKMGGAGTTRVSGVPARVSGHWKLCRLGRLPLAGTEHTEDFRCHVFARTDAEFRSKETSSSISGQYLQLQPLCFLLCALLATLCAAHHGRGLPLLSGRQSILTQLWSPCLSLREHCWQSPFSLCYIQRFPPSDLLLPFTSFNTLKLSPV